MNPLSLPLYPCSMNKYLTKHFLNDSIVIIIKWFLYNFSSLKLNVQLQGSKSLLSKCDTQLISKPYFIFKIIISNTLTLFKANFNGTVNQDGETDRPINSSQQRGNMQFFYLKKKKGTMCKNCARSPSSGAYSRLRRMANSANLPTAVGSSYDLICDMLIADLVSLPLLL